MKNKTLGIFLLFVIILVSTGCATWDGIKQDSSDGWEATKNALHEATE
jgi:predicted small secreted protein